MAASGTAKEHAAQQCRQTFYNSGLPVVRSRGILGGMKTGTIALSCSLALTLCSTAWLWLENDRLRAETEIAAAAPKGPRKRQQAVEGGGTTPAQPAPNVAGTAPPVPATRSGGTTGNGPVPAAGGALRIVDTGDGNFVVSDPAGTWRRTMSAGELREFVSASNAAMQAAATKTPGGPSWSPGQAAGAPNTRDHGDYSTAWAPQAQDGGAEWLQLKYAKSVEIGEITIHETYNPGAVSRVSALMPDRSERVIWQGTMSAEDGVIERAIKVPKGIRSDQIRVELDTSRVPGWNEIDAVELVGTDGSRQWATESTASSYFGQGSKIYSMDTGLEPLTLRGLSLDR